MKKVINRFVMVFLLIAGFLLLNSTASLAQTADAIIGKWQNPDGNRQMEIYKSGNAYFGKISWVKTNDGKAKVGDVVLENMTYSSGKWQGTIKAMSNEIECTVTMSGNNIINIKGKKGFMSKTKTWTRIK